MRINTWVLGSGTCITVVPIHNYFLNILLFKQLPRLPTSGDSMDHGDHSTNQIERQLILRSLLSQGTFSIITIYNKIIRSVIIRVHYKHYKIFLTIISFLIKVCRMHSNQRTHGPMDWCKRRKEAHWQQTSPRRNKVWYAFNKRAQRALGPSPERTTNVVHQILVEDL